MKVLFDEELNSLQVKKDISVTVVNNFANNFWRYEIITLKPMGNGMFLIDNVAMLTLDVVRGNVAVEE